MVYQNWGNRVITRIDFPFWCSVDKIIHWADGDTCAELLGMFSTAPTFVVLADDLEILPHSQPVFRAPFYQGKLQSCQAPDSI
jgi:hypothetical protein